MWQLSDPVTLGVQGIPKICGLTGQNLGGCQLVKEAEGIMMDIVEEQN